MAINFRGYLFQDDGDAVSGATVQLLETGTTTVEASTTTDSDGLWYFNEGDQDRYDVKITSGTSVRYIRWDDQISLKELDVRNNTGNTTPAATFTNLTNNASNQVAVFRGANTTRADDDEIYLSFELADSGGTLDEFARITAVATDVTATEEDGALIFSVADHDNSGNLQEAFRISSSTGGTVSQTFTTDSVTFGTGGDVDVVINFNANSANGVITWMEDEDYFKFSDDILMNSTERINFYDTAIYIYSSTDGQLDLVADTEIQIAATTIDINGAVALNGAITGATDITLSGELDAATLDLSSSADIAGDLVLSGGADGALQFANAGENSIKIPDNQASALIIEEADNAYITFVTTDSSEAITVAKATTFSGAVDIQGGYANGGGAPYDGVVDAGGGGNWTTAQAGDNDLDAGDYTMLVKGGAYSTLTVSTDDARIVVEPGATFSGAVVLSGNDVTLVLGAGCAMSGLITLSGNNCSLICENGVDTVGVLLSGNGGYLNGGGWGSLMDGGSGVNGINITGDDCIVENVAAKNTSPGPGTHSATRVAGARAVMRTVKVLEADIAGIETTSGGTDLLIDGCFLLDSDNEGMYIAGPRTRIIGCHVLSAGADAIALKSTADNSLVIGCVVQDQTGDSVEIDINSENCVVIGNRLDGAVDDNSGTSTVDVDTNNVTAF